MKILFNGSEANCDSVDASSILCVGFILSSVLLTDLFAGSCCFCVVEVALSAEVFEFFVDLSGSFGVFELSVGASDSFNGVFECSVDVFEFFVWSIDCLDSSFF